MSFLIPGTLLLLQVPVTGWRDAPPLPRPVSNNAVAAVEAPDGDAAVFSFLGSGVGPGRGDLVTQAFRWDVGSDGWREVAGVPGPGRLGAAAATVRGRIYLVGGYGVDGDGGEVALGRVDVYDPGADTWSPGAPLPVPVADAVSGVWRDSLVYLVGGRHDGRVEARVQVYDPARDTWAAATPIPGPPVFGHAGAVARDAIVYVDGARPDPAAEAAGAAPDGEPVMESSAWRGDIDPEEPTRITWQRLPGHPGPARFGGAAAAVGTRVVFVGGADRPWDREDGAGDGRPGSPVGGALVYDLVAGTWGRPRGPRLASMDHRGLVRAGGWLILAGGMEEGGRVTDRVWRIPVLELLAGGG